MPQAVVVKIDGQDLRASEGQSLLNVALEAGIYIPHLCSHPDLPPVGACRLCLVEIEGRDGPVTSCTETVADGMVVRTRSERIDHLRRLALELMLTGHPSECTTCPKYLKCELQSLTQYLGVSDSRLRKRSNIYPINEANPLFVHDLGRCILCERCVRACENLRGVGILKVIKEENGKIHIGTEGGVSLADAGCRFCGACVEVCPTGTIRDKEGLIDKAATRQEALVPCRKACPAHVDIPRYIRLINHGDMVGAIATIREKAPFPGVLGYICNHQCELACRRDEINEAVSVRTLKRYAAEHCDNHWGDYFKPASDSGKKVAVVGAGPAGMAAAWFLRKKGHAVTVFESASQAGGMMRYGIPGYRLPRKVVDAELKIIADYGVTVVCDHPIANPQQLMDQGFDGVVVAIGAHRGIKLPITGLEAISEQDVLVNIDFLRRVNSGEKVNIGQRVVILGGGNVAFDCAGLARRLGAHEVAVACLEAREAMKASPEEIEEALEEGVKLYPAQNFEKLLSENGRLTGVECRDVRSFSFEADGRLNLEIAEGTEKVLPADTVIFAVGQIPDVDQSFGLATGRGNRVQVDTMQMTSVAGVFAAGDFITGTAFVVSAVESGRQAAAHLDKFLGGDGAVDASPFIAANSPAIGKKVGFAQLERENSPKRPLGERDLEKVVDLGFNGHQAQCESDRCLQCDLRLQIEVPRFWNEYSGINAGEGGGK